MDVHLPGSTRDKGFNSRWGGQDRKDDGEKAASGVPVTATLHTFPVIHRLAVTADDASPCARLIKQRVRGGGELQNPTKMPFPQTFDAYVPSNTLDILALSNIKPDYVPFETLNAVPLDAAAAASFAYAKRITPPAVFIHVLRTFYFALALLYNGFPSGTPGVPQIGFQDLTLRLYHTCILHDLGWTNTTEGLSDPAHTMTFELHGAFMAYEHLHAVAPRYSDYQVGDIVQSIVLHTSSWPIGNSSATQQLMSLTAFFDVEGFDTPGPGGIDYSLLFNRTTVQEIEKAYPRGDFFNQGSAAIEREFEQKPNCLLSHLPGGLDGILLDFLKGPIVPEIDELFPQSR
ncbi:hypothetical protein B0H11DRAFT_2191039 [Mycena galericulata]|nr:hypothetical protein B0H11DRAFT_2191039 [Mycena galericulata]